MSSTPAPAPALFTTFAIAGGLTKGPIGASFGQYLARALIKQPGTNEVRILGRVGSSSSPAAADLSLLGIHPIEVSYGSPSSLASALKEVDVVISTLAGAGFAEQVKLARAGKEVGVKLFVPNDFGPTTMGIEEGSPAYAKVAVVEELKKEGVEVLRVFCGIFADWVKMCINVDPATNEILIVGEGQALLSWTSREDVAEFLAHVLTHLAPSQLATLDPLSLEGSSSNLLSLAEVLIKANPAAKVVHKDYAWAQARAAEGDFFSMLRILWDQGGARSYVSPSELSHGLWPEWKPTKAEEYLMMEGGSEETAEGKWTVFDN